VESVELPQFRADPVSVLNTWIPRLSVGIRNLTDYLDLTDRDVLIVRLPVAQACNSADHWSNFCAIANETYVSPAGVASGPHDPRATLSPVSIDPGAALTHCHDGLG
jgi:hypothetical protein